MCAVTKLLQITVYLRVFKKGLMKNRERDRVLNAEEFIPTQRPI